MKPGLDKPALVRLLTLAALLAALVYPALLQAQQKTQENQLDGSQISFVGELGEKDGPYDLALNTTAKSLILEMQDLRMELQLEKAYREALKKALPCRSFVPDLIEVLNVPPPVRPTSAS